VRGARQRGEERVGRPGPELRPGLPGPGGSREGGVALEEDPGDQEQPPCLEQRGVVPLFLERLQARGVDRRLEHRGENEERDVRGADRAVGEPGAEPERPAVELVVRSPPLRLGLPPVVFEEEVDELGGLLREPGRRPPGPREDRRGCQENCRQD
jgi:hypothetical protein